MHLWTICKRSVSCSRLGWFYYCSIKSFNLNVIHAQPPLSDSIALLLTMAHLSARSSYIVCMKVMVMALCRWSNRSILHITDDSFCKKAFSGVHSKCSLGMCFVVCVCSRVLNGVKFRCASLSYRGVLSESICMLYNECKGSRMWWGASLCGSCYLLY